MASKCEYFNPPMSDFNNFNAIKLSWLTNICLGLIEQSEIESIGDRHKSNRQCIDRFKPLYSDEDYYIVTDVAIEDFYIIFNHHFDCWSVSNKWVATQTCTIL